MNKAVFLDRDGVINIEKDYVHKIEDFTFIEGVFEALQYLQQKGYLLVIITNQSGIGRGLYSEEDFDLLSHWMLDEFEKNGILISKVYYCPFHPEHGIGKYKAESLNRKPHPGMILEAQKDFDVDLSRSILIGDKESDIKAGINAGVGINILVKSGHINDPENTKASLVLNSIKDVQNISI